MKLFQRNRKPAPQPETVNIADFLDVPVESIKPVQPEFLQFCACCGTIGATIPLKVSYFGYIDLPHVKICDACETARVDAKNRHYVPLKKTLLEHPAVPARRKRAPVVAMEA